MNPQLEELAALYVLDRLDPGERTVFETELLRSPELAALVRELEAALAREIQSLPQVSPPAGLLPRVESHLAEPFTAGAVEPDVLVGLQGGRPQTNPTRTSGSAFAAFARWGIAAVIAVSVATLAVQSLRRPSGHAPRPVVLVVGLDARGSALAEMPLPPAANAGEGSFVQLASLAEKFWDDPKELPVAPPAAERSAHGYALFDPGSHQGFIAIRHLPALAPGLRYHLWIADPGSGRVTEAGVLPATNATSGLYSFAAASPDPAKPARLNFFVTAEDASTARPPGPRGTVVLGHRDF
ncbi:MAG TPA: hypothetical protein VHE13_04040 [Opitutus sp.]|nr:hypothetical protein [Opitutus sp.]